MEIRANFSAQTHPAYAQLMGNLPDDISVRSLPGEWNHVAPGGRAYWMGRGAWHAMRGCNVEAYPKRLVEGHPFWSAQAIPLNRVDWALDVDLLTALVGFRHEAIRLPHNKATIRRALRSRRCRAITYWSQIARDSTERFFDDDAIRAKGLLMPPAVALPAEPSRGARDGGSVHGLYVGRMFAEKGGPEAMEVAQRIVAAHPEARFTFVTNLPAGYVAPRHERITIVSKIPAAQLDALWAGADFLLFPTYGEVFGLVVLEALAHGVPVVALDEYAIPEMLRDGIEGRLIRGFATRWYDAHGVPVRSFAAAQGQHSAAEKARVLAELTHATSDLVRDPALRARMGAAGRERARSGPFSQGAQRKALVELSRRFASL